MKKGITLIALIISIIVLLILTGITLTAIMGDSGIIANAQKTKIKTEDEHAVETLQLAWSARMSRIFEGTEKVPDIIDDAYLASVMTELNSDIGKGKISGISYSIGKKSFQVLYEADDNLKYEVEISQAGQVNLERNIEASNTDTKYSVIVNNDNDVVNRITNETPAGLNTNIYAFYYADTGILAFSNSNTGETADATWNNINDNFSFNTENDVLWKDYRTSIKKVTFLSEIYPTNMDYMFCGLENLTSFENLDKLHGEYAKSMKYTFSGLTSTTSLVVSNFRTDSVENMEGILAYNVNLTSIDLGKFNLINCNNIDYAFKNCSSLVTYTFNAENTNKISIIKGLFEGCSKLVTVHLEKLDLSGIIEVSNMFKGCSILQNVFVNQSIVKANKTVWQSGGNIPYPGVLEEFKVVVDNHDPISIKFTEMLTKDPEDILNEKLSNS